MKSAYITRTATFSKDIARYMQAKDAGTPMHLSDLGIILNYILNGVQKHISDQDLFKVHLEGHRMGLNFLVDLSRDAILDRIDNHSFMFEALDVADHVGDKVLFEKVAETFHSCNKTEQFIKDYQERLKSIGIQGRFMLRSLARHKRRKGKLLYFSLKRISGPIDLTSGA